MEINDSFVSTSLRGSEDALGLSVKAGTAARKCLLFSDFNLRMMVVLVVGRLAVVDAPRYIQRYLLLKINVTAIRLSCCPGAC